MSFHSTNQTTDVSSSAQTQKPNQSEASTPAKELFRMVGILPQTDDRPPEKRRRGRPPWVAAILLGVILLGCLFAELLMNHGPAYLDLEHISAPPSGSFYFGTDPMGRDVFSISRIYRLSCSISSTCCATSNRGTLCVSWNSTNFRAYRSPIT